MNKRVVLVVLCLAATGCANVRIISDGMQPDGSYRIQTGGSVTADYDDLREEAVNDATQLCPNGYDKKGELRQKEGVRNRYTLIIRCKGA